MTGTQAAKTCNQRPRESISPHIAIYTYTKIRQNGDGETSEDNDSDDIQEVVSIPVAKKKTSKKASATIADVM